MKIAAAIVVGVALGWFQVYLTTRMYKQINDGGRVRVLLVVGKLLLTLVVLALMLLLSLYALVACGFASALTKTAMSFVLRGKMAQDAPKDEG